MSGAQEQVAKEIVAALESRIQEWIAERERIEVMRSKQDRKEERYNILGELIAEAEKEISTATARIPSQEGEVKR